MVDSQLMQQGAVQLRQTHSIVYGLIACFVCRSVDVPLPLKPPSAKNSGQENSVLESFRCQLELSRHGTADFVVELFDVKGAGHTKRSALRLG